MACLRRRPMSPDTMLVGHREQKAEFEAAFAAGRLQHAWLLAGPRGIGKRRFADWAALELLGAGADETTSAAARLIAGSAHPDMRVLEPEDGSATPVIKVEQVRELGEFLHSHPALGRWRILIVDTVDQMNNNAVNAFLKELEEPRPHTLFLLVSHNPARLLPTVRSRCRTRRFRPLSAADTLRVLQQANPEVEGADLDLLARLAEGKPGSILQLGKSGLHEMSALVEQMLGGVESATIARSFQAASALPRLAALLDLVPRRLAAIARTTPDPGMFALYDEAEVLARDAVRLALDRPQVALALADILARAGQIQKGRRLQ